jgi:hypothetical protein
MAKNSVEGEIQVFAGIDVSASELSVSVTLHAHRQVEVSVVNPRRAAFRGITRGA